MIRTPVALLLVLVALVLGACEDPLQNVAATSPATAPTAPRQSAVLAKELAAVTNEAPTSEALPPELVTAALEVTAAEESKLAAGRFNDAANRLSVKQSMDVWIDFNARMPGVTRYLHDQDKAKPLTGVRLELLARLLKPERNPAFTSNVGKK